MEHHTNDLPWRERARTVYAEVDSQGRLDMDDLERLLIGHAGDIKYVTVTAASNVTGYVNNVHHIAKLAHRHGAKIIVDGAQIVAHRPFSMLGKTAGENIDFFVFSAHKMYAPFGGGAVVGLKEALDRHVPEFYGGGMVEAVCDETQRYHLAPDSYEAGSPNYAGVAGMLKAIECLRCVGFDYIERHEQRLLRRALDGLRRIPGVTLYGDSENIADRVGIAAFNLHGMRPEETADFLAGRYGIAVRHAAFCAHPYVRRLTHEPENGMDCQAPVGMVRASFGIYTDEAEVDCLLTAVEDARRHSAGGPAGSTQVAGKHHGKPYDRG